jgi:hypothetical protein
MEKGFHQNARKFKTNHGGCLFLPREEEKFPPVPLYRIDIASELDINLLEL